MIYTDLTQSFQVPRSIGNTTHFNPRHTYCTFNSVILSNGYIHC